jgi:chromosome segregation ATPase
LIEQQLADKTEECNAAMEEIDRLQCEIASLQEEIETSNEQIAAITTENAQLQEEIEGLAHTADQYVGANDELKQRKDERDKLLATLSQSRVRCTELDKVNESLHIEIETLISEKKALEKKVEENEQESRVFVANYEKEAGQHKKAMAKCQEQNEKLKTEIKELEQRCERDMEDKTYALTQRVFELENQLTVIVRNPHYTTDQAKLKVSEEEIRRLQAKLLSAEAESDRRASRQSLTGDAMVINSLRLKIRELERRNDQLAFENRCFVTSQEHAQTQLEEMQKLLEQGKLERDEVWRQLAVTRQKNEAFSEEMQV